MFFQVEQAFLSMGPVIRSMDDARNGATWCKDWRRAPPQNLVTAPLVHTVFESLSLGKSGRYMRFVLCDDAG
jgi:hypothetical protein